MTEGTACSPTTGGGGRSHGNGYRDIPGLRERSHFAASPGRTLDPDAVRGDGNAAGPLSPMRDALEQVQRRTEMPTVPVLGEPPGYWPHLRGDVQTARGVGPRIHDARVAAPFRRPSARSG
jgi:hypothetical protein